MASSARRTAPSSCFAHLAAARSISRVTSALVVARRSRNSPPRTTISSTTSAPVAASWSRKVLPRVASSSIRVVAVAANASRRSPPLRRDVLDDASRPVVGRAARAASCRGWRSPRSTAVPAAAIWSRISAVRAEMSSAITPPVAASFSVISLPRCAKLSSSALRRLLEGLAHVVALLGQRVDHAAAGLGERAGDLARRRPAGGGSGDRRCARTRR